MVVFVESVHNVHINQLWPGVMARQNFGFFLCLACVSEYPGSMSSYFLKPTLIHSDSFIFLHFLGMTLSPTLEPKLYVARKCR